MANLQSWSEPIPDIAGTILAARAWCFFAGRLFPIYAGMDTKLAIYGNWYRVDPHELDSKAWGDAGVQTAECPNKVRSHVAEGDPAPSQMCICGFWGLNDPSFLVQVLGLKSELDGQSNKVLDEPQSGWHMRRKPSRFVLGTVRMWGKVIPGEAGWRSSKAQIDGIIATSHPEARRIARAYGVPKLATWPELTPAMVKKA
jgi:hypothetical protein